MSNDPAEISTIHRNQDNLLLLLKDAQSRFGYLPHDNLTEIANSLGISNSAVYGVATFYSFLSTRPLGKNIIKICKSLPCYLKSSKLVIESVQQVIGIKPGETTNDGQFSFQLTNCIGACDQAPAMMINTEVYGNLTAEIIKDILKSFK